MTAQGMPHLGADAQAVYRCFSADGHLLYVGTTGNFGRRLAEHAQKIWFLEVRGITLEWYSNEVEARAAEKRAISIERPHYNIVHKDELHRRRAASPRSPRVHPDVVKRLPAPERKAIFVRALESAQEYGISPQELRKLCQLSKSLIHKHLAQLVQEGAVIRIGHGRYRSVPGVDVAPIIARLDMEARLRDDAPPWLRVKAGNPTPEELTG